ncbi:MAG TPA: transposase [Bacteroidales bacterium]|nr:transposase [Bacteroidales bacterium]
MSEYYKAHDDTKAYFITSTVVNWEKVFIEEKYINILIDSIRFCQNHKGMELYAYCLMPTHFHIIARGNDIRISNIMRDMKKFTSVKIIKEMELSGDKNKMLTVFRNEGLRIRRNWKYKFWQDGFHPIEISTEKIFKQKLNYIHLNPVDAGFVSYATEYKFSSARNYSGMCGVLDIIIE